MTWTACVVPVGCRTKVVVVDLCSSQGPVVVVRYVQTGIDVVFGIVVDLESVIVRPSRDVNNTARRIVNDVVVNLVGGPRNGAVHIFDASNFAARRCSVGRCGKNRPYF